MENCFTEPPVQLLPENVIHLFLFLTRVCQDLLCVRYHIRDTMINENGSWYPNREDKQINRFWQNNHVISFLK